MEKTVSARIARVVSVAASVAGVTLVLAAFFMFRPAAPRQPLLFKDIPIPFSTEQATHLKGSLTFIGQRNNIDVYDVAFNHAEPFEHLSTDKIYLVHVPNDLLGVSDVPLDLAMSLPSNNGSHVVNYYGYRYSDAAATMERRDVYAARFTDRFPGQFFASQAAHDADVLNGNALAGFEASNGVRFRRTDDTVGGVRTDPSGALYVFIVNEANGADIRIRGIQGCGNGIKEGDEECDDGNSNNADNCSNQCVVLTPIPFGGPAGNGVPLTIRQSNLTGSVTVAEHTDISLLRFTATAADLTQINHLAFTAQTGSLVSLSHYRLWQDTDGNGRVDTPVSDAIAPVGGFVTFDTLLNWSGALVSASETTIELHADVPSVTTGLNPLRVVFATAETDYVGAARIQGTFPLLGIRTDGVCATTCAIDLTTATGQTVRSDCGNGIVTATEACDDGNRTTGDGCSSTCQIEMDFACTNSPSVCTNLCGNGICAADETAVTVLGNGPPYYCPLDCTAGGPPSTCGNGITETAGVDGIPGNVDDEQCDDASNENGDGCSSTCHIEQGFVCSGSPSNCEASCGNGVIDAGETCDQGNNNQQIGDGCSNVCHMEPGFSCTGSPSICTQTGGGAICGNGTTETAGADGILGNADDEQCDDASDENGDGCSGACKIEQGFVCSGSPSNCEASCGNGVIDAGETCDQGNNNQQIGDGCSNVCHMEPGFSCTGSPSICTPTGGGAVCGDGVTTGSEACDDHNVANGDGCNSTCQVEQDFSCAGSPSVCTNLCGNGTVQPNGADGIAGTADDEQCDDASNENGDGCSSTCHIEQGFVCSGSPSNCEASCGNGVIDAGETCDQGNNNQQIGDGCSNVCRIETNYRCTGTPSTCQSYLDFVRNLADLSVPPDGVITPNEALILTFDVADVAGEPYSTVRQYDIDNDGDVDNIDVGLILTQLDILAPN